MLRTICVLTVVALPFVVLAQQGGTLESPGRQSSTTIAAPSRVNVYGGGGGGGYYGGGTPGGATVAGSALNGMASAISAKGDYNLSTSQANINNQQAASMYIQNRQQATNAYFEMRAANTSFQKAERAPPATMEQMVRWAKDGVPRPLSTSEVDPVNGVVNWPDLLQAEAFAPDRTTMEKLLAQRSSYGVLGYADQRKARATADSMLATMKTQIRQVPPEDYVASKNFLQSITYSLTNTELN